MFFWEKATIGWLVPVGSGEKGKDLSDLRRVFFPSIGSKKHTATP
jgi:hypothetical protein